MSALKYTEAMLSRAENVRVRFGVGQYLDFAREMGLSSTELSRKLARRRRERKERGECF